nr:hypothetical protein CFP56_59382 [Quercus suber]
MESDEPIPINIEFEREDLDSEDELDEVGLAQSQLEELTEDIMDMNINKDEHMEDTTSMGPPVSSNPVS